MKKIVKICLRILVSYSILIAQKGFYTYPTLLLMFCFVPPITVGQLFPLPPTSQLTPLLITNPNTSFSVDAYGHSRWRSPVGLNSRCPFPSPSSWYASAASSASIQIAHARRVNSELGAVERRRTLSGAVVMTVQPQGVAANIDR